MAGVRTATVRAVAGNYLGLENGLGCGADNANQGDLDAIYPLCAAGSRNLFPIFPWL